VLLGVTTQMEMLRMRVIEAVLILRVKMSIGCEA
jgi:hypothetical protein